MNARNPPAITRPKTPARPFFQPGLPRRRGGRQCRLELAAVLAGARW